MGYAEEYYGSADIPTDTDLSLVAVHVLNSHGDTVDKAKVYVDESDALANVFFGTSIMVDRERLQRTVDGVAEFLLVRGVTYKFTVKKYARTKSFDFTVPDASTAIATQTI